ncbi:MAG: hypothetical protein ACI87N_003265 [Flavobacteriales bacterium]|jgi:hypothetical protein
MEIIMDSTYQEEQRYFKAKKRVNEIRGFYSNLASYAFINLGLLALNLWTSPNHLWFYWPLLGWGIGVVFHGIKVFNYMPFIGQDWEEQKIKEFIVKEQEEKKNKSR